MTIWDHIAGCCSDAGTAAQKGKVRAEMMLIDREINNIQKTFGVSMYDYVDPLSQDDTFYSDTDEMTELLRPPLVIAQKEMLIANGERNTIQDTLQTSVTTRETNFPADKKRTVGEKFTNIGMLKTEAITKAKLSMAERKILSHKGTFGMTLYASMREAEDDRGFVPSDKTILRIYELAKKDIAKQDIKRKAKEEELIVLGGQVTPAPAAQSSAQSSYSPPKFNGQSSAQSTATEDCSLASR